MDDYGYGLWILVANNSAIFIVFAFSFFKPRSGRDWRAMGAFSAFVVALFSEMYGFPLRISLLSGWLGSRFPELTLTHSGGHLWNDLIGWTADPHVSPFHTELRVHHRRFLRRKAPSPFTASRDERKENRPSEQRPPQKRAPWTKSASRRNQERHGSEFTTVRSLRSRLRCC